MTIEIAGVWEQGWTAPMTEIDHWWPAMNAFNVDALNMTPISGISRTGLTEYASIEDMLTAKSALTLVFVDENGTTELSDFVHPENALYIFGRSGYSPFAGHGGGELSIHIDCDTMGMFWPHQAMSMVLYDRRGK